MKPTTKLFADITDKQWQDAEEYLAMLRRSHPGNSESHLLNYALCMFLPVIRSLGGQVR